MNNSCLYVINENKEKAIQKQLGTKLYPINDITWQYKLPKIISKILKKLLTQPGKYKKL